MVSGGERRVLKGAECVSAHQREHVSNPPGHHPQLPHSYTPPVHNAKWSQPPNTAQSPRDAPPHFMIFISCAAFQNVQKGAGRGFAQISTDFARSKEFALRPDEWVRVIYTPAVLCAGSPLCGSRRRATARCAGATAGNRLVRRQGTPAARANRPSTPAPRSGTPLKKKQLLETLPYFALISTRGQGLLLICKH